MRICSAVQITVERFSSFIDSLPKILKIALLLDFTNDYHAPSKCGAAGGLKVHFFPFVLNCAAFQKAAGSVL